VKRLGTVSKILALKGFKKEEIELEVKRIKDLLAKEQQNLESMEKTFAETVELLRARQNGQFMDVHELALYNEYCSHLSEKMEMQKTEITRRLNELAEKHSALFNAYKEKRLLEILKDRVIMEKTREETASDQKESDAIFLMTRPRGK
jgi:flagellar export protein FliJ